LKINFIEYINSIFKEKSSFLTPLFSQKNKNNIYLISIYKRIFLCYPIGTRKKKTAKNL